MKRAWIAISSTLVALVACGEDEAPIAAANNPYGSQPNTTVVVGGGPGAGTVTTTPSGDGCIQLPSGECVKPQQKCNAGERADVVIDSAGKVLEVICYPAGAAPTPIDGSGNVELGKENKGVVSIDGVVDGVDVAGDVTSSGNNVTVYGEGPGASVIGGNVDAQGNNFAMRGVTVQRNVTVEGNNAALVLCVIEGDLVVRGNNLVVADCLVTGKIRVEGNNAKLVANEVGGGIEIEGNGTVCDANVAWTDSNGNKALDPGESGAAITCGERKK